jgi:hypothetical protein
MPYSLSRRIFSAGLAALPLMGQQKPKEVTQASVPDDPDAPGPQSGTLPEAAPFQTPLSFTPRAQALRVEPFSLTQVRLLPGPFLDAQEADRTYMHALPVERLVHTFRLNAGLESTAVPLGGWEKPDSEVRGHFTGHFLSACALLYSSSGDETVKAKGDAIVAELAKCQGRLARGYLSAFPIELFDRLNARKEVWAPFYTVHKIMAGLFDMHQLCGNAQALAVLIGMAQWVDAWTAAIPPDHMQWVLDTEYGGMGEVLYNLAVLTGENRFAVAGDRFVKLRFANPLALHRDQLRGLHANTHIPQVIAGARRYEISGDPRFREVASFFWNQVAGMRTYATGGTSNNEGWLTDPGNLAGELARGVDSDECCCAYNMLRLTRRLYIWTADPRYFDFYERVLWNHRLGTIDLANGHTQYYLNITPGSWRSFATAYDSFWCCNGTGVEEHAKYNDSIYFHSGDSLYVNLFIASELDWKQQGAKIRQETRFPESPSTELKIETSQPSRFAVHLRIPSWIAGFATIRVNGKESEIFATPGSYATLLRTWKTGDRVELDLPMTLRDEPLSGDEAQRAILYGPLLLAGEFGGAGITPELRVGPMGSHPEKAPTLNIPALPIRNRDVSTWIRPGATPLTFDTTGPERLLLRPFHKVSDARYNLYWRTA